MSDTGRCVNRADTTESNDTVLDDSVPGTSLSPASPSPGSLSLAGPHSSPTPITIPAMRACLLAVVMLVGWTTTMSAQRLPQTFEVASIGRNVSNTGSWSYGPRPGGLFDATNMSLASLIELAYGVR